MRLDKFLCESTDFTRSMARTALARGEITVNGEVLKRATYVVKDTDVVAWEGEPLAIIGLRHLMLHKPAGYECTNKTSQHPSVMDLLDVEKRDRLHTVGRLDVDTTGLLFITDDGQWTHRVISPRHQTDKVYLATLAEPLPDDAVARFADGMLLKHEDEAVLPAQLEIVDPTTARVTVQEGKYHQIKRMFGALGNRVVTLHRERIGPVVLDPDLAPGESRYLTDAEVQALGGTLPGEPD